MKITATKISQWAKTKKAQATLPWLIRRLVHTVGKPTEADFPAGDSTGLPGWDGELVSESGSAWIPKGKSYWEFSCEAAATRKANKDYEKRTRKTFKKIRSKAILVVVTARKWSQKKAWLKKKRQAKKWAAVRAYDADDIEQWLEQNAAVALEFGEQLGLIGQGVESLTKQWEGWSQQSNPQISAEALFIDRQSVTEKVVGELRQRTERNQPELYAVRADSVDEAVAFVCASLIKHLDLTAYSVVVTSAEGWRFVEANPSIKIAIAARPEIAEKPTLRKGLVVVIPYAAGDMAMQYRGVAAREQNITVERPKIGEFEKALVSLGIHESDAKRLASTCGRSWSVFRRHHAINPAIRRPTWLTSSESRALSTLCLLAGWSAKSVTDRDLVSRLSARPYEETERDLRFLSRVDDPPVLQIGDVWKAKSPLELLYLFGDRITTGELDRFFELAREILTTPDPVLELPDEQRHAAQIYGKVRPQSGLLMESLCDTLIKLAVRSPEISTLSAANIEARIAALVRELLDDADGTRWLSLYSLLPSLAEAAPDAFLRAVEISLDEPDSPVTRLMTETTSSVLMGRCWHAGLLWALETLAWAPNRLARVALLLARLAKLEIKGNWGNTPKASLLSIFRSWLPQTAANLDERIALLDTLINTHPDVAFDLLDALVYVRNDVGHYSARPNWRDDDSGAGHGVPTVESHNFLLAAVDKLIACSAGQPQRIARLFQKISIFDPQRTKAIIELADAFTNSSRTDEARQVIRDAVRKRIYWYRNYAEKRGKPLDDKLRDLENLYKRLSPKDLVVRHSWLFADSWPDLPTGREKDHNKRQALIEKLRVAALQELYADLGLEGVERLAAACPNQSSVGITLANLELGLNDLADWIVANGSVFTSRGSPTMAIRGLLVALKPLRSKELIQAVLERGKQQGWDAGQMARFLTLAPEQRETWDIVASCGPEVEKFYWSITTPGIWLRSDESDFEFALRSLVNAGRPRTALQVCHLDMNKVDPTLLTEMLERMLTGEEPDGPVLDSWYMGEAIEFLEASGAIDKDRLIRLEFGLIPALGYDGEQHAKSLYEAVMAEPKLFTDLLCMIYRPRSGDGDRPPPSEAERVAAKIAYRVLNACQRQPGTQPDGNINRDALEKFIDETRKLCREADRLEVCDSTLGQILAHIPADSNGIWPAQPARDVLNRPELDRLRRGFAIGTRNKRGTTSRAYDEGGVQERSLAETYRQYAKALQNSHPNLAAVLEDIAGSYESEGLSHDVEAQLRREGV